MEQEFKTDGSDTAGIAWGTNDGASVCEQRNLCTSVDRDHAWAGG